MFTRLRPIFALFVRSLREQSRAKFTPLARGAVALLLLLFIAGNERNFTNNSAPGVYVLGILTSVNFFVIAVFGLSTFASAITEEKEEDTLGLLQMTRLNPLAILLGKSTARLCEGLLLLAVQVPFTMLCITLGGVSMAQVLHCYAILAAFLFFLCNVALFWSVVCRRTRRATSMTTLTGIVLYVVPLFLMSLWMRAMFASRTQLTWFESFARAWVSINPLFDLLHVVEPRSGMFFGNPNSVTSCLVGGAIFFGLAWLCFAPCCNSGGEIAAPRGDKAAAAGVPRRTAHPRTGTRAIAWKDFHFLSGGRRGLFIRTVVYALFALLLVWWLSSMNPSGWRTRDAGVTFWIFGLLCFSVELGLVSARMFAAERKSKTLGVLYTLPFGAGRIIREKILGALPQLIPSLALAACGFFLMFNPGDGRHRRGLDFTPEFCAGLTLGVSGYVFFAVLVMYLSLRMRRAPFATGLCIVFLLWIVIGFSLDSMRHHGSAVAQMLTISVIAWILTIIIASQIPHRIAVAAADE